MSGGAFQRRKNRDCFKRSGVVSEFDFVNVESEFLAAHSRRAYLIVGCWEYRSGILGRHTQAEDVSIQVGMEAMKLYGQVETGQVKKRVLNSLGDSDTATAGRGKGPREGG